MLLVVVSPIDVSVEVVDFDGESGDFVAQSGVDWWPMFRHDPKHTGRSPVVGPQQANLEWTFTIGAAIRCSPAIAPDGTIYVGSNDGKIYAINPDGTPECNYSIGGNVYSSPAIGSDGTIYVGSWREDGHCSGRIYAINPNCTHKWSYTTIGDVSSSPVVDASSGVIYVAATCDGPWNGRMYAFYPNGTLKWEFSPPSSSGWITSSPAIREDGVILFGDYTNPDGIFWALYPNGTVLWQTTIPCPFGEIDISSSAAVDSDGMIYFGGSNTNRDLWALYPNGTIAWSYRTGGLVWSSPAIGSDGTVYVGSYDDKLYAINKNGALKWTYVTGGDIYSSPAIGADGTIYVGSNDGKIYAINPDGTLKWSLPTGGAVYSSPAIGSDGRVYVGSYDGKLYAFGFYDATVQADCCSEGTPVSVNITMDGSPTGFNTSHTFTDLTGTHTFTVPSIDPQGHSFKQWSTGETNTTITITSAGTYTAYYGTAYSLTITTTTGGTTNPSPGVYIYCNVTMVNVTAIPNTVLYFYFDHWELDGFWNYSNPISVTMDSDRTLHAVFNYNVTIKARCWSEEVDVSVNITMDGSPTGYNTPHTFTGLTGTHTFTVPSMDPNGHGFIKWSTDEISTTLTVTTGGTCTAYYTTNDVAVKNVTLSKTVVVQGCCMNITVTVENQGNFTETFGVVAPYFDGVVIPTSQQWETFWSKGDVNRDGYVDDTDLYLINYAFAFGGYDPEYDVSEDGFLNLIDLLICQINQGLDIWTYFGLPLPHIGTQRGVRLYPGYQTTLTFTWNTTGVTPDNYTITANATIVPGETNTTDNTYTDGLVEVKIRGDVNDNGAVNVIDMLDLKIAIATGKTAQECPLCDINCNGAVNVIDMLDLKIIISP